MCFIAKWPRSESIFKRITYVLHCRAVDDMMVRPGIRAVRGYTTMETRHSVATFDCEMHVTLNLENCRSGPLQVPGFPSSTEIIVGVNTLH